MEANKIIIKPLLSEKSYSDIAKKKYWFVVDKKNINRKIITTQMIAITIGMFICFFSSIILFTPLDFDIFFCLIYCTINFYIKGIFSG